MVGYGSTGSNSSIPGQLPANLVQAPGSIINISGGYLSYASGFVKVSTLITADGRLVSATNADPNVAYIGVCCSFTMDHARWGVTEIFTSALRSSGYEQSGYIQGGAGGSLNLAVQSAVLDGQLYAGVVSGVKQRTAASMPAAAALSIDSTNLGAWLSLTYGTAYSADNIFVSDAAATTAAGWVAGFDIATSDLGSILSANLPGNVSPNSVYLPTSWLNSGVANVSLAANSNIVLNPKAPPRPVPRLVPRTKLQGNLSISECFRATG